MLAADEIEAKARRMALTATDPVFGFDVVTQVPEVPPGCRGSRTSSSSPSRS